MTVKEIMPNASNLEELVKCTRCKNKHTFGERLSVKDKKESYKSNIVCPRCGGHITVKP